MAQRDTSAPNQTSLALEACCQGESKSARTLKWDRRALPFLAHCFTRGSSAHTPRGSLCRSPTLKILSLRLRCFFAFAILVQWGCSSSWALAVVSAQRAWMTVGLGLGGRQDLLHCPVSNTGEWFLHKFYPVWWLLMVGGEVGTSYSITAWSRSPFFLSLKLIAYILSSIKENLNVVCNRVTWRSNKLEVLLESFNFSLLC